MNIVTPEEVHFNAINKGWWVADRQIPELLCLVHAEVSEALEAYRENDDNNFREELADIIIRVWDICESLEIDIAEEVNKKHKFNLTRPYRHGGKKC